MTTRSFIHFSIAGILCISMIGCTFYLNSKPCNDKTTKKEVRPLNPFNEIDLSTSADIELTQGSPQKFEIDGPACDLENTITTVSGSTLSIEPDHNLTGHRDKVTIFITVPNINGLSIAGSGSVYAKNAINTDNLKLEIAGSGSIIIPQITATAIKSSIAGSGDIELSGAGRLQKHTIEIAGSGDIKAKNLPAADAEVSIAGSGSCYLNVTDKLKASIMGSGDIFYLGKPTLEVSVAGSGKVKSLDQ